jgi:hypothetical protein
MDSIFEKVKNTVSIAEVAERFGVKLDRHGKALCPFHSEDTPSFPIKKSENIFKCFGCGESGDAIDFVAKLKGIEPLEAAKLLAEMYGLSKPCQAAKESSTKLTVPTVKPPRDANVGLKQGVKDYITACEKNIGQTDYFLSRGLTEKTIKDFRLGYDPQKRCVVIPYSSAMAYYQTRSVEGKEFRKPPTEQAGQEPLWGAKALQSSGAVFVVESPICAMSIAQCGGQKLLSEIDGKSNKSVLVLALDNDKLGHEAQQQLANALFEKGIKFIVYNVAGEYKDPNEMLMADPKQLRANVREGISVAKKEFSKLKKLFSANELQQREMRSIRWIVQDLLPEGLAILAAPSKYGKSWMMMQLCMAVAGGKPFLERKTERCGVAYFSLEDSERRFKGRLNKMTDNKPAPAGFYGMVTSLSMATGLFEQLTELMELHPDIGLIIIDTFQKVRGGQGKNESVYGADYREMGEMKAFADKHGICVLLVHHLRKQDDDNDVFNRISGSMALMGASDTTWVLSRKKRGDTTTVLTLTGRDVDDAELVIAFDKPTVNWNLIGNAEDEAARLARAEYETNAVVKTIKVLVEKNPCGWCGNCSEIKLQIYEQTGALFQGSADTVGRTISKYLDRFSADGVTHT